MSESSHIKAVCNFLKQKNLTNTLDAFLKESGFSSQDIFSQPSFASQNPNDPSEMEILANLFTVDEDSPDVSSKMFDGFTKFLEAVVLSPENLKPELRLLIFPLFCHIYLHFIVTNDKRAQTFFHRHVPEIDPVYSEELSHLYSIRNSDHLQENELVSTLRSQKFHIRMSKETFSLMKKICLDHFFNHYMTIIKNNISIEVYSGAARNEEEVKQIVGFVLGENKSDTNKEKFMYGIVPSKSTPDDDLTQGPQKNRNKKNDFGIGSRTRSYHAPPPDRVPYPSLSVSDERWSKTRLILSTQPPSKSISKDTLPSICFHSAVNFRKCVTTMELSYDCSMLATGLDTSVIYVYSLRGKNLRELRSDAELQNLNINSNDIFERIFDDKNIQTSRKYVGHTRPISDLSFNSNNSSFLSCSEDSTVKLWSLVTHTCIATFQSHIRPVWKVEYCPKGFYFLTAGSDNTAKLHSLEHQTCLRMFVGHASDVTAICFHPNSNYVATGSSDRTVRIWDVINGQTVRFYTGFKKQLSSLKFTNDGRFLITGEISGSIKILDIAQSNVIYSSNDHHSGIINSISLLADCPLFATAGQDNLVNLYNFDVISSISNMDDYAVTPSSFHLPESLLVKSFYTKNTPVMAMRYISADSILHAAGPFSI